MVAAFLFRQYEPVWHSVRQSACTKGSLNKGHKPGVLRLVKLNTALVMQNQIASYLPSPSPVVLIVFQKEPYQYVAVFVNQTREQAEETFKQKYNFEEGEHYEVKEYKDVESYSVTEDGSLLVNGSYK